MSSNWASGQKQGDEDAGRQLNRELNFLERNSLWVILILFGAVVFLMYREWNNHLDDANQRLENMNFVQPNDKMFLEKAALIGDSFGGINALFSGIAMVAAMTAIAIQVFEFRFQRLELLKQTKEMMDATRINKDRFKLDTNVFEYDRLKFFIERFQRFRQEDVINAVTNLRRLTHEEFSLIDAFQLSCDQDTYKRHVASVRSTHTPDPKMVAVDKIRGANCLFDLFIEIAYANPQGRELYYVLPIIHDTHQIIRPLVNASLQVNTDDIPLWVPAAEGLLSQFEEFIQNEHSNPQR